MIIAPYGALGTDKPTCGHLPPTATDAAAACQNGYAERLIWTIKDEEVDLSDYQDYSDTRRDLGRFLDEVYIHKRIHCSLGDLTPAESEGQWRREQAVMQDVH